MILKAAWGRRRWERVEGPLWVISGHFLAQSACPLSFKSLKVKGETLMIKALGAIALTIVLLAGVSATADPEACRGALRILKSARGGVGDYLRDTHRACR